jgi:hypothetical protein
LKREKKGEKLQIKGTGSALLDPKKRPAVNMKTFIPPSSAHQVTVSAFHSTSAALVCATVEKDGLARI